MFSFLFLNQSFVELEQLRIIAAIVMLGIATSLDLWKREIHDILWIIFACVGVLLIFLEPAPYDSLITIAISLIIAPVAIVLWRLGLFGGADAFALILVAFIAPQITFSENFVSPITTLTNAVLFSTVPLFINVTRNVIRIVNRKNIFEGFDETRTKKIMAMFIGYRAKKPKFSFSIERKEGEIKKLNLSLQHAEHAEFCSTPNTWVTPGIPYILFITAGFLIQLVYGDIIFRIS